MSGRTPIQHFELEVLDRPALLPRGGNDLLDQLVVVGGEGGVAADLPGLPAGRVATPRRLRWLISASWRAAIAAGSANARSTPPAADRRSSCAKIPRIHLVVRQPCRDDHSRRGKCISCEAKP
jgi:hypothetical protein